VNKQVGPSKYRRLLDGKVAATASSSCRFKSIAERDALSTPGPPTCNEDARDAARFSDRTIASTEASAADALKSDPSHSMYSINRQAEKGRTADGTLACRA